ncbi:MAG: hypothetical protein HFJ43_03800 [Clostridia bacterium]|nr:hypothetical protein [Clostridia bacterium]
MKKMFYLVLSICIILSSSACGRNKKQVEVESRDEYYRRLAEEITDYQDTYDLIKEYSEDEKEKEEFKKRLAFEGNYIVQEALLNSEDLSSEILTIILENPKWKNPNQSEVVSLIKDKIKDSELTSEQEVRISKIGETAQLGLLAREELCCEALCYIADTETTLIKNLNYYEYRDLFYQQGAREWSDEEKIQLINTENKNIIKGLSLKK